MNNINPTLILGQAQSWLRSQEIDIPEHHLRDVEVRVYDQSGAGYYFVRGQAALKWYRDDDPTDGHYNNCSLDEVQEGIDAGGRVQIVGYRGASYGVWSTWTEFNKMVLSNNKGG